MLIIDAGHGGKDSGAVGNGLLEKDLALKISKIQARLCQIYGIEHYLTRDSDVYVDLNARSKFANDKILKIYRNDTILISNHINSSDGIARGFEIIKSEFDNSEYANRLLELVRRSDILSVRKVYSKLNKQGLDYFHMIRAVSGRSYILEWGFIKNLNDMQSLQNNIIVAASLPIVAYLNDNKVKQY